MYAYTDTAPSSSQDGVNQIALCPESGAYWAGYRDSNIDAGTVVDEPYYVQMGIRNPSSSPTDDDMLSSTDNLRTNSYKSEMDGSGMLGASNGCRNVVLELHRGAIGGVGNQCHTTNAYYGRILATIFNLLRGMTWAEAVYYRAELHVECPVGDPLWAPYGRSYSAL